MGIDYIVDLACEPKRVLSVERIVALVKGQSHAAAIIDMARRKGDKRPSEELSFTRIVMRPAGPVEDTISVGSLLKQTQQLNPFVQHCQGCAANFHQRPFGCYGSVAYPISKRAEEWFMSLLPRELNSAGGHMLRSAVTDFKYTGGMFLNMRPQEMFFESRTPVKRKWGSLFSSWSLTSDQLFEMVFGLGSLQSSHCQMMCIILGLIKTDENAAPPPTPDAQSEPLARAINAMGLAGQLGVNFLVDA